MENPFVWFDNRLRKSAEITQFYSDLFGWNNQDSPGMKVLASWEGPFAGVFNVPSSVTGGVPYIEVEDIAASEKKAVFLGGNVVQKRTKDLLANTRSLKTQVEHILLSGERNRSC